MNRIDALRKVATHNLTRIDASMGYDRITDTIISLSNVIMDTDTGEDTWWLGEHDEFSLADLITGAYWHYTEWHGGQNSKGYAALCALGRVFDPGMTSPEEEQDNQAYLQLDIMASETFGEA